MAKREKIIVFLMTIAIVFGGYNMFFASSSPKTDTVSAEKSLEELEKFVSDIKKTVDSDPPETDLYIIGRAASKWAGDPFLKTDFSAKPDTANRSRDKAFDHEVSFVYSGFIETGHKKLAVISGIEYEVGEQLDMEGYTLMDISQNQVTIGIKGTKSNIILPLNEN